MTQHRNVPNRLDRASHARGPAIEPKLFGLIYKQKFQLIKYPA